MINIYWILYITDIHAHSNYIHLHRHIHVPTHTHPEKSVCAFNIWPTQLISLITEGFYNTETIIVQLPVHVIQCMNHVNEIKLNE